MFHHRMDPYQITAQPFDQNDPKNYGRPIYFNLNMYLSVIEQMISADEVERALWMLDNLPAWYRDNVPIEVIQLRNHLLKKLYNTLDYSNITYAENPETSLSDHEMERLVFKVHRARKLKELVESIKKPLIIEMAPGGYLIPKGLKAIGINFAYRGEGLAQQLIAGSVQSLEATKTIFVAFELIEHLHNPAEIYQFYLKQNINFDYICLSTPLYTWKGGNPEWHTSDLGHLRTYTPSEFMQFAQKYWPEYTWTIDCEHEMYLEGKRN